MAGDLHDDAVQSLTAARMHLSILDRSSAASAARPPPRSAGPRPGPRDLEQGLVAARTFLFNLRPPLLDSDGLGRPAPAADSSPADGLQDRGHLAARGAPGRDFETVAFRVVQEALANVAKHADATTVRVWGERRGRWW